MNLCIIGTGYIGLVGAAVFADWGNNVTGVDIDEKKIERIKKGDMPIYEPGLSEIVLRNVESGRLNFTTSLKNGMKDADIVFICVGTPQDHDGSADLSYVFEVAKEIGKLLESYKVIVVKSTVPVGTNARVKETIKSNLTKNVDFDIASNPEFLREGSSVEDMQNTDRTIVGADSKKAFEIMENLYKHLNSPIVECDLKSAEMIKYASNSFLATKVTFINEISHLCEKTGADISMVAYGMGLDKRIGSRFLNAGLGYGGSCFPKDVAALHRSAMDHGYHFKILKSVMEANELQKESYVKKITLEFGDNLSGLTIACLGLAFKNNTDDVRESVSVKIIRRLRGLGAHIRAFDPQANENGERDLGKAQITYCDSTKSALEGADILCILTEWDEFRSADFEELKKSGLKAVFDGRNLLDPAEVRKAGLKYFGTGKKNDVFEVVSKG